MRNSGNALQHWGALLWDAIYTLNQLPICKSFFYPRDQGEKVRAALLIFIPPSAYKIFASDLCRLTGFTSQGKKASTRRHNMVLLEPKDEASIWPFCVFSSHWTGLGQWIYTTKEIWLLFSSLITQVINLPEIFPVLSLKVSHPRKHFSSRHTGTVGHLTNFLKTLNTFNKFALEWILFMSG